MILRETRKFDAARLVSLEEFLEISPKSLRPRKTQLDASVRRKASKAGK